MQWNETKPLFKSMCLEHEKANRSNAHQTLRLEKTVLLLRNQVWNKEFKLHFVSEFCLYSIF